MSKLTGIGARGGGLSRAVTTDVTPLLTNTAISLNFATPKTANHRLLSLSLVDCSESFLRVVLW